MPGRCRSGKAAGYYSRVSRARVPLILAASLAIAKGADAQARPPVSAVRTGGLAGTPLTESSGVAVSRRHPGVLWTHNDSNHEPHLYAITERGAVLATFQVVGARAVDWEDLALGPCPPGPWTGRTCLYVADTGDNAHRRTDAVIYTVPEPDPGSGSSAVRDTEPARGLRLRFADGPQDIEALALDSTADAHLITRGRRGHIVRYVVPRAAFGTNSVLLTPVDTLPIRPSLLAGRWVTGAAISPSGRLAAVRTFTEVYFFRPGPGTWTPDDPPCRLTGLEPQGEAVDFLDEQRLVLTSERGFAQEGGIHVVRCR